MKLKPLDQNRGPGFNPNSVQFFWSLIGHRVVGKNKNQLVQICLVAGHSDRNKINLRWPAALQGALTGLKSKVWLKTLDQNMFGLEYQLTQGILDAGTHFSVNLDAPNPALIQISDKSHCSVKFTLNYK